MPPKKAVTGPPGVSTIVGRLSGGYFLDRFNAGRIAAICAALPIASCLLLLALPGDAVASLAAVSILGLAFGAEYDSVGYLASRLFGMRSFGVLFGTIIGLLCGYFRGFIDAILRPLMELIWSFPPVILGVAEK